MWGFSCIGTCTICYLTLLKYFTRVEDVHEHNTRFSRGLSIQYAGTNYYRFSIECTGPKIWNGIPASIKEATAFCQFKRLWASTLNLINSYTVSKFQL